MISQIQFNINWYFLGEGDRAPDDDQSVWEKVSWLTELVACSKSVLPHLRRIGINRQLQRSKDIMISTKRWSPPGQLQNLLDTNGIQLDASVGYPRGSGLWRERTAA